MDETAAAQSSRLGGAPSTHRSRYLTEQIAASADLVLTPSARTAQPSCRSHRGQRSGRSPSSSSPGCSTGWSRRPGGIETAQDLVDRVARLRGTVPPPADPADDDVDDPYRRSEDTHVRVADEIDAALTPIAATPCARCADAPPLRERRSPRLSVAGASSCLLTPPAGGTSRPCRVRALAGQLSHDRVGARPVRHGVLACQVGDEAAELVVVRHDGGRRGTTVGVVLVLRSSGLTVRGCVAGVEHARVDPLRPVAVLVGQEPLQPAGLLPDLPGRGVPAGLHPDLPPVLDVVAWSRTRRLRTWIANDPGQRRLVEQVAERVVHGARLAAVEHDAVPPLVLDDQHVADSNTSTWSSCAA